MNATEKDLEKYIRFLALKSTQVVVQSRLGEKIQTQGSPMAGNDWFNIVIKDHPEVNLETKRVLNLTPGESIMNRFPICVEISLKTAEGDQMVLEVWSLEMQAPSQHKDDKAGSNSSLNDQQALKGAHTIYNRMGIMIKSLISLTRATPAYKLSRRQCPDSYRIYYRIYVDRPQVHTLGEGHKHVKIGQLNTIVGILTMSVAYRTKMTITPTSTQQRTNEANVIMLKSDHFRPSGDGQNSQQPSSGVGGYKKGGVGAAQERKVIDIEKPLRPGAFADLGKLRQYTEEDYILPETPPFEWLLKRTRNESSGSLESLSRKSEGGGAASPLSNGYQHNINNNVNNNNNNNMPSNGAKYSANNNNYAALINNNVAGFKNLENDENAAGKSSVPSIQSSSPPIKSLIIPTPPASRHGSAPSLQPATTTNLQDDDNLLKELNFPFASSTSHVNDLAKFYRDCYHAPPLHCLSELQSELTAANTLTAGAAAAGSSNSGGCGAAALAAAANNSDSSAVDELSRQLEQFETSLEDYDKLVAQLGLTGSSSTSSRSSGGLQMSN